jgi:plastocyanin
MFIFIPYRHPALLLTGMLGSMSAACSKETERPRSLDSAQTAATDSASVRTDTSSARSSAAGSSAAQPDTPVTQPPAQTPKLPKPSIDPGRKTSKPMAVPKTSPAPPPDTAPAAQAAPAGGQDQWLKYDAASTTVTFELIAGPFNFNGYTSGGATLTVPPKANLVINFVNKDGTPHSAEVISGDGPIPNAAVDPAIPRAYTNKVLEGLPQEAKDNMRFTVPESGKYRIFCGVPGHGLSGMWIWLTVDPAAKAPSFGPTKA